MTKKEKFSDPSWWQPRWEEIDEVVGGWQKHSRQSEATLWDTLWHVPDDVLSFVKDDVHVVWKRASQVALLLRTGELGKRYTIVLDTKIECQSRGVRQAILALKIAEAYLLDHPREGTTREEMVKDWDIDLGVLEGEHAWGFDY